ncbi:MAG: flavocytochrome c [Lachnospiraceae bacterium]|nr:flavocytochrome c [Lachnospiraceae bacterium]
MKKQNDRNIVKWISMNGLAGTVSMLIVSLLLVIFISRTDGSSMSSAGSGDAEGPYTAGSYSGKADGFGGPVEVTVEIGENGGIKDLAIKGDSETPDVGGAAIPGLKSAILQKQSSEVDTVSGATFTSDAVKKAVAMALAEAGGEEGAAAGPKAENGALFIPGTYTAAATGFGGDVNVTVEVSEDKIEKVDIEGEHETENIGSFAVDMLDDRILEAQSPNVDALTGATVTSNAVLGALKKALTEAGADMEAFPKAEDGEDERKTYEDLEADIVIIGAGGAGMTAAISASQAGKSVILLEKMPYAGGNTTKATGGMNAAETHYQKEQGIEDSVEQFVDDTMEGGHNINDKELVTTMAENSAEAIDWLDSIGAPLPKISFSGGATNQRIHAPEDGSGVGAYLVTSFLKKMEELNINVMYNTTATKLMTLEGSVVGVMAESDEAYYTIHSKAVILATGGFGNNADMIVNYRKDLEGTVTTSAPGVTGDGISMAEAVGAGLVDIDQIQLHPTVEQKTSMLITESVRGDGAILVNQEGKRFTNELLTRDVVSAAELEQPGSYAYIIFDQRLRDGLKAIEKYVSTGITVQGDTIEDLAKQIEVDPAVLAETLKNWNQCVADQKDPEFGRDTGMEADLSQAPYYAIKIAPGIHHTMGGVHIDTEARVIDVNNEPIPGLFAAGEVVGGVHGGNRLGGNAVADIVVIGKIASQSAVEYCDKK